MRLMTLHHKVYNEFSTIQGCIKGEKLEQYQLFKHYFPYCMQIARRYSTNESDSKTIVNDSFLKVFAHIKKYRIGEPFKFWVSKIVVNTAIDHYRKVTKMPILENIDDHQYAQFVEDDHILVLEAIQNMESILPLIQQLSPQYRLVFNLFVFEEYTHKEIAKKLNIAEGTSKSNYSKARSILKEMILNDINFNDLKMKING